MRKLLLLLVVLAMVATACGDGDGGGGEDTFLACQVTDTGGIDDASFNQTAYNGMLRAEDELGVEIKFVESQSEADFVPNIQSMIAENCDIVITVGFLLGDATIEQSAANPDTLFVGLDQSRRVHRQPATFGMPRTNRPSWRATCPPG